jgi:hypothetical protein
MDLCLTPSITAAILTEFIHLLKKLIELLAVFWDLNFAPTMKSTRRVLHCAREGNEASASAVVIR